jgi:hypothetical protein
MVYTKIQSPVSSHTRSERNTNKPVIACQKIMQVLVLVTGQNDTVLKFIKTEYLIDIAENLLPQLPQLSVFS